MFSDLEGLINNFENAENKNCLRNVLNGNDSVLRITDENVFPYFKDQLKGNKYIFTYLLSFK